MLNIASALPSQCHEGKKRKFWVPTDEEISFVWLDQPFAIHIPFQMETFVDYDVMGENPRLVIPVKLENLHSYRGDR